MFVLTSLESLRGCVYSGRAANRVIVVLFCLLQLAIACHRLESDTNRRIRISIQHIHRSIVMSGLDFPSPSVDQIMLSNLLTLAVDWFFYAKRINSISKPLVPHMTYSEEKQRNLLPRSFPWGSYEKLFKIVFLVGPLNFWTRTENRDTKFCITKTKNRNWSPIIKAGLWLW